MVRYRDIPDEYRMGSWAAILPGFRNACILRRTEGGVSLWRECACRR
jgi:hypothetical protein